MSFLDNLKERIPKEQRDQLEKFGGSAKKAIQNVASQESVVGIKTAAKKFGRNIVQNVNDVIMSEFEKGDKTSNQDIQAFFVTLIGDNKSVLTLNPEKPLRYTASNDAFECDVKGWYYIRKEEETNKPENEEAVLINGNPVKAYKRNYIYNEDVIFFKGDESSASRIMIFSILNQKDTVWHSIPFSKSTFKQAIEEYSFPKWLHYSENYGLMIEPGTEKVYMGREQIIAPVPMPTYKAVVHEDRHFLFSEDRLYFQMPLTKEEHKSLALMVHQLQEGENLDIHIRERVVQQNGKNKKLLENINISIKTGEMVLVLGGSGAGKTTFFNAVMGSEKADADIYIGQNDLYRNYNEIKHMIGYVPQKDLVRDTDTVFMTLKNAAQMKLPREFTADSRLLEQRISDVLKTLNIEKEADNLVSKLSGGQKKRLSAAVELISEPAVFFLDEPDSGLDGSQARSLMNNLREIANTGKIIIIISHSPDRTPELYDKVLVLAKSQTDQCGKLAFYGGREEALEFFGTESMELIVGKIDEDADYFIEKFQKNISN